MEEGKLESKINVDCELINQIFPHDFSNIDQEDNQEKNDKKQLEILQKELEILQKKIKVIKKEVSLKTKEKLNWNINKNPWLICLIINLLMIGFVNIFRSTNCACKKTKTKKT